jgi:hypothetical protein
MTCQPQFFPFNKDRSTLVIGLAPTPLFPHPKVVRVGLAFQNFTKIVETEEV